MCKHLGDVQFSFILSLMNVMHAECLENGSVAISNSTCSNYVLNTDNEACSALFNDIYQPFVSEMDQLLTVQLGTSDFHFEIGS